jgi:hypothetical protein
VLVQRLTLDRQIQRSGAASSNRQKRYGFRWFFGGCSGNARRLSGCGRLRRETGNKGGAMRRGVLTALLLVLLSGCAAAETAPAATVRPQPTMPAQIPAYAELAQGKTAEGYQRLGMETAARTLVVYGDFL